MKYFKCESKKLIDGNLNNYSCMFANEINQLEAICVVWLLFSWLISICSL